ncbi:hypothetical protein CL634_08410, partial [bacterium]|nr:hypothetical protein [bacterium]
EVPSGLPTILGSNPPLFTGIESGDNKVFVNNSGIFSIGDQVIINPHGYYGNSGAQEEHVVTNISYYQPDSCCNVTTASSQSAGNSYVLHRKEEDIFAGDVIKFSGYDTLYKVNQTGDNGTTVRLDLNKILTDNVSQDHCVCLIRPMLETQDNLYNDYPEGTKVARKYCDTTTVYASVSGDPYRDQTVLFIESNDIDGSTTFVDSSISTHTITPYSYTSSGPHHESGEYKFGISSIHFNDAGDGLYTEVTNDAKLGSNWTYEMWHYPIDSDDDYGLLIENGQNSTDSTLYGANLWYGGSNFDYLNAADRPQTNYLRYTLAYKLADDSVGHLQSANQFNTGVWHHVAVVNNETSTKLFVNGSLEAAVDLNQPHKTNYDAQFIIGAPGPIYQNTNVPQASYYGLNGFLDQIRVSKVARYTTEFNVPTEPFDNYPAVPSACDSTCCDTSHLYLDVGTYSGLGPSWTNGMGENEPQWDWFLSGYREHFIDFSGVGVNITGNNTFGVLSLVYPDKGI